MATSSRTVLRTGVGITFIWIGVLIFRNPEGWGAFMQPWAFRLLDGFVREAMLATAALDVAVGLALFVPPLVFWAAAVGLAHIGTVLITVGVQDVTVRDIAVAAALLALLIETWPAWLRPHR